MNITLVRDICTVRWTLGVLWVDGKFFGYSVEDCDRLALGQEKIKKLTAIPCGAYTVRHTWSPKYQAMVPELLSVPGFRGVRIHVGNDEEDTEGCILPGLLRDRQKGQVLHSAAACRWLYERIKAADRAVIDIRYDRPPGFEAPPFEKVL